MTMFGRAWTPFWPPASVYLLAETGPTGAFTGAQQADAAACRRAARSLKARKWL